MLEEWTSTLEGGTITVFVCAVLWLFCCLICCLPSVVGGIRCAFPSQIADPTTPAGKVSSDAKVCFECQSLVEPMVQPEEQRLEGVISSSICQRCHKNLHSAEWLIELVRFFLRYEPNSRQFNPSFPLRSFIVTTDILTLIMNLGAGVLNTIAIVYNWHKLSTSDSLANKTTVVTYSFFVTLLPWVEFSLLVLFYVAIVSYSFRAAVGRGCSGRGFAVLMLTSLPLIARVNAMQAIVVWNVNVPRSARRMAPKAMFSHSGPLWLASLFTVLTVLAVAPLLLLIALFPVLAIFVKVLTLVPNVTTYVTEWNMLHWLTFFNFLNNCRELSKATDSIVALFSDLTFFHRQPFLDLLAQGASFRVITTLWATSDPQELYEIFIVNQALLYVDPLTPVGPVEGKLPDDVGPLSDVTSGAPEAEESGLPGSIVNME